MDRHNATNGLWMALVAVFGLALLVPAVAPATQAAPLTVNGGSNTQQWAYGAQQWVNTSGNGPNLTYSIHAFFGWAVVFTATNTSSTTVELEAQRTVAASLFADFCSPTCTAPKFHANFSATGWEKDAGFANLTTTAVVYSNGTAMSAVGISNASAQSRANLSESMSVVATLSNGTHSFSGAFNAAGQSSSQVAFAPALGLVPWNVTPHLSWNSTSQYTASGSWSLSWNAHRTSLLGGTISASGNPSGSVTSNGTIVLQGMDLGMITLHNGRTVPVIALFIAGPFDDLDGIILVPHDFNVFGAGAHAWNGSAFGIAQFLTTAVDLRVDALHHHVEVDAAASSATAASGAVPTSPTALASPMPAAAAPSANSATIQAQPESVPQAQQQSACYVGGCPGAAAASSTFGFVLLVGLVVGLVVGTVGAVEYRAWSRRRARQGLPPQLGYAPSVPAPPEGAIGGTSGPTSPGAPSAPGPMRPQ